ncbi:MAG: sigma-70 family RNA polymerase sigma factor [Bacteroidota bacterium]
MLEKTLSNYNFQQDPTTDDGLTLTDEKLWESLIQGSEIAFDEIYRRYFDKLYVYGRHLTQDTDLIKDAIQELFIELWKYRKKLSSVKYVKSYLHKSVRRKILKDLKSKRSTEGVDLINESLQVSFSRERSLINEQTAQQQKELISKAFKTLSDRQKEAVVLKYYNDLSYQEIADIMSLSKVKSARTLLYRAIDVLKASMHKKATSAIPLITGISALFSTIKDVWVIIIFAALYF